VNDPTRIDMNACATLSLADAALVLGIHRSTASELYRRGEFPVPVLQIGHRCRVAKIHLERFLLAGTAEANASD
jgi:predicted DNA-binding transcriptional regulator AlpA